MVFNSYFKGKEVSSEMLFEIGFSVNGSSNFMTKYVLGKLSVNLLLDGSIDIYYNYSSIKRYPIGGLIYDDLVTLYNLLCK